MEPVDLTVAKPPRIREVIDIKPPRPLFRPYEDDRRKNTEESDLEDQDPDDESKSGGGDSDSGGSPKRSRSSTPLKPPPPPFLPIHHHGASPAAWPGFFLPTIFPNASIDASHFDPYKAAMNMAALYGSTAAVAAAHHHLRFYTSPPYQWYQKRISRPLCGKYVKSGPAASRSTLMALRQRVIQRQQMKFFLLHSVSSSGMGGGRAGGGGEQQDQRG